MSSERRVALIDADCMLYICTHNKKDAEGFIQEKSFEEVCTEADVWLAKVLTSLNTDEYIAAFTVGRGFRYELYPEYKGNRVGFEKPKYFQELKEFLLTQKHFTYQIGLEADDIINILKRDPAFYSENEDDKLLVSNDKDILNLPGTHYNLVKNDFVVTSLEEAEKYFYSSMITGDTADNIKGIEGKGKKAAETLLEPLGWANYPGAVFDAYVRRYGDHEGLMQYYKNYRVLRILNHKDHQFNPYPKIITYE